MCVYTYIYMCVCRFKMWFGADPGTSGRNGLRNPTRAWAIICPVPVVKHVPRAKPAEPIIGVSVTELCPTAVHPFKNDRLWFIDSQKKRQVYTIYMCVCISLTEFLTAVCSGLLFSACDLISIDDSLLLLQVITLLMLKRTETILVNTNVLHPYQKHRRMIKHALKSS